MSRPPASMGPSHRDRALDGLRGLAALLVFVFHYGGGLRSGVPVIHALGFLTQGGWMGLDLFFALSGFLITEILVSGLSLSGFLSHFFVRRALRILPLYWAALLATAGAALACGAGPKQLRPLLLYIPFLQNLPSVVGMGLQTPPPLPLYHLWSLAVEAQFYLLWPALVAVAKRPRRVLGLCVTIFVLSCLFRLALFWYFGATAQRWAFSLPTQAGALAAGGAVAMTLRCHRHRPLEAWAWRLFFCAALWIAAEALRTGSLLFAGATGQMLGLPAVQLLAASAVALALRATPVRRLLSWLPLAWLGQVSYGFYVLHILLQPLYDSLATLVTQNTSGNAYQAARLLSALPLTLIGAWLSFRWLEQPVLRWKRRLPEPQGR